jgi:hypothetical protein
LKKHGLGPVASGGGESATADEVYIELVVIAGRAIAAR